MTMYIQRLLSSFCAPGDSTDPVTYQQSTAVWASQDVYPAKILKLDNGEFSTDTISLAASGSVTVELPLQYSSADRMAFYMRTSQTVKVVTVSPALATSTVLVRTGSAQDGLFVFVGRVTSITITNPQAAVSTIEYLCHKTPDLTDPDSWRDGVETTGTVST